MTPGLAGTARRAVGSSLVVPVAAAAAVLASAAVVATGPGSALVPPCPLHALTGLWCPLCGGTRAVVALTRGDVGAAAGFNVLVLAAVPVVLALWVRWVLRRRRDPAARMVEPPPWALRLSVLLLLGFAVLRNLPGLDALAP